METELHFEVLRDDLRRCRFVEASPVPLAGGDVRVRVDRFAFTANNVSYAVAGDGLGYWKFFPAAEGWGRIPVWGFADVMESRCEAVGTGERLYGYFPMSTRLVLRPERVSAADFLDATPHRRELPAVYNQYLRCSADPLYDRAGEEALMLHRPLLTTAFLLDDFLADEQFFGADRVVIASASSKTALGLAFLLSRRRPRPRVVGLTSGRNRAFVEGLGCYDETVLYDAIATLTPGPAVFVDMAGDGAVTAAVHERLGDALRHSATVGATHWEARGGAAALPGPKPTFFFAPAQIQKRSRAWGPGGVQQRLAAAWKSFLEPAARWIRVNQGRGQADVERVYRDTLEGRARPDQGHVLSLARSPTQDGQLSPGVEARRRQGVATEP